MNNNTNRSSITKSLALLMLTVMITLLAGKSMHIYNHFIHDCEHAAENHHEHNHHDCKICNLEILLFDKTNEVIIPSIICLITPITNGYIPTDFISTNVLTNTSRAPPQPII